MQHQAGRGDVAGDKLRAGERLRSMLQKLQDQFLTLPSGRVAIIVEGRHQTRQFARIHQQPFPKSLCEQQRPETRGRLEESSP